MKFIKLLLLLLLLSNCNNLWNKYPWFNGDYELAKSVSGNKLIMLDFYADWWVGCKRLDAEVFRDSRLIELSKDFISLKLDISIEKNNVLSNSFNVLTIPQNIFVNSNGNEVGRIEGFLPADIFIDQVKTILYNHKWLIWNILINKI